MAQSAKDYAKEQLGNLDLSYLDNEKNVANNVYNTSKSSLQNNFNNLLEQINNNRADTRKNFNTGRATVAENSYNTNRNNQVDLASRGVGNSGLKGLGEVGNRMETGKQYSSLANDFYDKMNTLDTTEKQDRSQYDTDQQGVKNTLDQTLAGITSRGAEANNAYNSTLGQLAEGVQNRWDTNANAEKSLAQQKAAAAQAHSDAVNAARQQVVAAKRQALTNIVTARGADGNLISPDLMKSQIVKVFDISSDMADKILQELNLSSNTSDNTDATDYVNQMVGGW